MSELWQTVIVAAVVAVAAVLLIRALRRRSGDDCGCGCGDCPLSEKCTKKDK